MRRGTFLMDGKDSHKLRTYIQDRPLIEAPARKVNWRSAYGVDGDIPFDEEAYENTDMELVLVVNGDDLIGDRQNVYEMLDTRGRYRDFVPYFDPGKIYRVQLNDKIQFENKYYYGSAQAASVKFTVKPYKYLIGNFKREFTTKTFNLVNPAKYVAQPLIRIDGNGNITIRINGVEFRMNNVSGHIVLDSERYLAYREGATGPLASENNKIMTREYPILNPGNNTIEIVGDVSKTTINPRWRSLV